MSDSARVLNVFVCYTPFHVFAATLVRDQFYSSRQAHENVVALLNLKRCQEWIGSGWDAVIAEEYSACEGDAARHPLAVQYRRAQASLRVRARLEKVERDFLRVRYHCAHFEEYLTNWLLFRRAVVGPVTREMFVIPDGALNYYPHRVNVSKFLRHAGKWLASRLAGIPFTPFTGLTTCLNRPDVRHQYAFGVDLVLHREKAIELTSPSRNGEHGARGHCAPALIVLGQEEYASLVPGGIYRALSVRLSQVARDQGQVHNLSVFYKPHHFSGIRGREDALRNLDAQEVDSSKPVEALLDDLSVRVLVSFNSSALLIAKLLRGNEIRCVSVGFRQLAASLGGTRRRELEPLEASFRAAGVEMVE